MAEIVTLQLPETLAQRAKEIAAFTHRRLEDVLVEWIDRAITKLPLEPLPDEQVLLYARCRWTVRSKSFLVNSWLVIKRGNSAIQKLANLMN
jgi:hypothetical protein